MIRIDHRYRGFVLQYWQSPHSNEELEAYFREQNVINEEAHAGGYVYVSIVRGGTNLSAKQRARVSEWVKGMPAHLDARSLASFVQINSAVARGVLTALRWTSPTLAKVRAQATVEEALDSAIAFASSKGIVLSDEGRTYALRFLTATL